MQRLEIQTPQVRSRLLSLRQQRPAWVLSDHATREWRKEVVQHNLAATPGDVIRMANTGSIVAYAQENDKVERLVVNKQEFGRDWYVIFSAVDGVVITCYTK